MTERMSALALLVAHGAGADALADFAARWRDDRLVIDKWFAVQASLAPPAGAVEAVETLAARPDFDWRNPNRFRALVGAFASGNLAGFHRADGAGYAFAAGWIGKLDAVNPQTAARIAGTFGDWRIFDEGRRAAMRAALEGLAGRDGVSRNLAEIVERLLHDDG